MLEMFLSNQILQLNFNVRFLPFSNNFEFKKIVDLAINNKIFYLYVKHIYESHEKTSLQV